MILKTSYDLALQVVLREEGGYVNNPNDPGGATYRGVTQATYNAYRHSKGLPPQHVKKCSMAETADIYRNLYWDKIRGDDLPVGVDLAVFDFAVNSGVSRASKMVQHLAGVEADGILGPASLKAISGAQAGLADRLCDERLRFLHTLRTFIHFGKGWTARVERVRAAAKQMRKVYSESVSH